MHAGSFGPGDMDNTFGPQVMYTKILPVGRLLARAWPQSGGWNTEWLRQGLYRYAPYGSRDRGDPNPRIFYLGPQDLSDPDSPKTVQ